MEAISQMLIEKAADFSGIVVEEQTGSDTAGVMTSAGIKICVGLYGDAAQEIAMHIAKVAWGTAVRELRSSDANNIYAKIFVTDFAWTYSNIFNHLACAAWFEHFGDTHRQTHHMLTFYALGKKRLLMGPLPEDISDGEQTRYRLAVYMDRIGPKLEKLGIRSYP